MQQRIIETFCWQPEQCLEFRSSSIIYRYALSKQHPEVEGGSQKDGVASACKDDTRQKNIILWIWVGTWMSLGFRITLICVSSNKYTHSLHKDI